LWYLLVVDEDSKFCLETFFYKGLLVFGGDFHDPAKSDLNSNNNPPLCKMGREEQIEEREVLDSIFPEEITG